MPGLSVKEKVLKVLEQYKGESVSGEAIAEAIGVSRTAIWKAINSLRDAGYVIEAVTNRGYSLSTESDVLSAQGIFPYLPAEYKKLPIHTFNTLESTNKTAKQMSLDNAPHGTVVLARKQTQGRGRLGRSFFSPESSGLYMSIILKPNFDISKSVLITTAASVAVCRAIEAVYNVKATVKWVNDIYISGKKVCGILTEAVTDFESGQIDSIILGIGINCASPKDGFPQELAYTAAALADLDPSAESVPQNRLAAEVISQVMNVTKELTARSFIKEYRERSIVVGKKINVIKNGISSPGKALYIDADGALIVQFDGGGMHTLNSGEISIRMAE